MARMRSIGSLLCFALFFCFVIPSKGFAAAPFSISSDRVGEAIELGKRAKETKKYRTTEAGGTSLDLNRFDLGKGKGAVTISTPFVKIADRVAHDLILKREIDREWCESVKGWTTLDVVLHTDKAHLEETLVCTIETGKGTLELSIGPDGSMCDPDGDACTRWVGY